jgi:inosine-uridine nucleoside N-ribohydrolase
VHDSSAVACLIDPGAFTTVQRAVRVATEGVAIGQTIAGDPTADYASSAWRDRPLVSVCVDVQSDVVLQRYRDTLALARDEL